MTSCLLGHLWSSLNLGVVDRSAVAISSMMKWWKRFQMTWYLMEVLRFSTWLWWLKLIRSSMDQCSKSLESTCLWCLVTSYLSRARLSTWLRRHRCKTRIQMPKAHHRWHSWCFVSRRRHSQTISYFIQPNHWPTFRLTWVWSHTLRHPLRPISFVLQLVSIVLSNYRPFHWVFWLLPWL